MSDISVLPDGSARRSPREATAATSPRRSAPAWPSRRSPPCVDGEERDLHRSTGPRSRSSRSTPRPAGSPPPLDGARARPGGARAVPGRHLRHRPGHRGRLLLRLRPARRPDVQPGRPRRDRGEDARDHKADQPLCAASVRRRRGARAVRTPYKREIIEQVDASRGRRGEVGAACSASTATRERSSTCATAPTCRDGRLGHFTLQAGRRRLLARRPQAPDAAAHLRHGMGERRSARRAPPPPRRGREARPPQARRELDLSRFPQELGPGLAVWHPKGATVRRLMEDYSRGRHEHGGYEFVYIPSSYQSRWPDVLNRLALARCGVKTNW